MNDQIRDVIIVGSGPAGYTAGIYAARAGMRPLVLEGSIDAGGALMNTTEVENFPGFPDGIMGPQLMTNMRTQAEKFGAELITDDATELELSGPVKVVRDTAGNPYRATSVILAMGSGYRHLGLPEESSYSGKGVSWCATCDGFFFRGKDIAVVGGGDSAVEEATFLTRFANSVTLIHRRDQLRASAIMTKRAHSDPKIKFAWNKQVVGLGGDPTLSQLTLKDTRTGSVETLPVSGLFEAIGHIPRSELIKGQVDLDAAGYVLVDGDSTRTNLPGVFACGDLVDHVYRQAITAAGTGCRAALDAEHYIVSLDD
ncbi:thioredoxin reductase (NADPH) [Propionibacterium cyclohexanicum]|uniref:Thioredoxin reductase n=1 Tax=Propionibacterium cyclohexanicum TaxID=64702 RepID=A0A1H9TSW7_9ACTN|nr:thioredoxin-disulfide reductase [Propionibacterium cyclohexanicum]SES00154.1 thioredoxin reductase (NADPH) [Propionibacterium cyclohexanicum]